MKYLILGNGPAGVIAAETLRRADPAGDIVMVGSEDAPPYSRMAIPYLLEGNIDEFGTYLRKEPGHYARLGITERRGRAVALHTDRRDVLFDDGSREGYDRLLVATGSHPIRPPIPGIDLPQVLTCWTLEDARAIAQYAQPGSRVVQLGAGFIGCIIMEALAARGVSLTVVELGDRMVPRMMTPKAGGMIRQWVESKGIQVMVQAGIDRIEPGRADGSAPLQVHLTTGQALDADLLIVSAGVAPNVGFLEATPVHVAKGVLVDDRMETSVPGIYAAGDVAEAPDIFTGAHLVSAIQPNAADQARVAALNMAGQDVRLPGVLGHQCARHPGPDLVLLRSVVGERRQGRGGAGGRGPPPLSQSPVRPGRAHRRDGHRAHPACGRAARPDPEQDPAWALERGPQGGAPAFSGGLCGL